ncbi:MAG: DNA-binding protein [Alphaproteobacteria bacterium]|nr:DNA-binding protein [Alphaproteobacteria bacterium]
MIKEYLTRKEAAEYLTNKGFPISPKTLAKYATVGGSPEYRRFGNRRVVYAVTALDEWAKNKLSAPRFNTSQELTVN